MSGGYLNRVSRGGNLIINPSGASPSAMEVTLRDSPWWILDLSPIRGFPVLRGSNPIIDGLPGRPPYQQQVDETTYTMALQVTGEIDASGASAIPSAMLQVVEDNCDFLYENLHAPIGAYRDALYVYPNGNTRTAQVQVRLNRGRQTGHEVWLAIDVTVPNGRI